MSWDKVFDEPIEGPDGIRFVTLRDAAGIYVDQLPDDMKALPEWDAAASALLAVVDHNGPVNFAHMGMLMALNRDKPSPPEQPRKKTSRKNRVLP